MAKPIGEPIGAQGVEADLRQKARRRRQTLKGVTQAAIVPHPQRNDLLPKLVVVQRAPGDLVLPKRNVRKSEPAHVRKVVASISALGFCSPVLIDDKGVVIDGAIRVEAAKQIGLPAISCIIVDHLNPSERRLLRLAANRLQEKGAWDLGELQFELDELVLEGLPVEIAGFSLTELDQIRMNDEPELTESGPLAPEPGAPAVARRGDVFVLGMHRIVCDDATDPNALKTLMSGDKAGLLLTDEPYNVRIAGHVTSGAHREFPMASGEMSDAQFQDFNLAWMGAALPHLRDGGLMGAFIDWRGLSIVEAAAVQLALVQLNLIVWAKTNAGMGSLYRSQHELLPLFKKGDAPHVNNIELGKHGRWRSNVWTYPGASSIGSDARRGLGDHPTVKPVALLEDALLDLTGWHDIVLDCFLGSGSTLIAAEKTGRRCRGLELDPLYVDVIIRRYEAMTGRPAILLSTGHTFAEVAAQRAQEAGALSAAA